jgi:hypothetical protein
MSRAMIRTCVVCLAATAVLCIGAAAQEQSKSTNNPARQTASIVGEWKAEDRHLAMGTLYQPMQGTRQRLSTVHFQQDGDRFTGYSITPKGEGLSGDKEWPSGRTEFRSVTYADNRLVFEFDVKEVKHGWRQRSKSEGTIRIEAELKGDRLVGKWGLFLKDGSEPFRGEWEAVRAGRVAQAEQKKEEPSNLPKSATWDAKAFDEFAKVVGAKFDPDKNEVHWTLQANKNVQQINLFGRGFQAYFMDDEGVRLQEVPVAFTPNENVKRGDKVRATLRLPPESVFSKTKKVVIIFTPK